MTHTKANIHDIMAAAPVIPVLNFTSVDEAVSVCRALVSGGLNVLEITMRHESALDCIRAVVADQPDAYVGAGTVLDAEGADAAMAAGAVFGVSPGLTPQLASAIRFLDWAFLPGIASVSEAMLAREWGFKALKCFPANVVGGPAFLKAVSSVLPDLSFCPTGGISLATAPDYLAIPSVKVVGGSWLAPRGADGTINPAECQRLAEEALKALA